MRVIALYSPMEKIPNIQRWGSSASTAFLSCSCCLEGRAEWAECQIAHLKLLFFFLQVRMKLEQCGKEKHFNHHSRWNLEIFSKIKLFPWLPPVVFITWQSHISFYFGADALEQSCEISHFKDDWNFLAFEECQETRDKKDKNHLQCLILISNGYKLQNALHFFIKPKKLLCLLPTL